MIDPGQTVLLDGGIDGGDRVIVRVDMALKLRIGWRVLNGSSGNPPVTGAKASVKKWDPSSGAVAWSAAKELDADTTNVGALEIGEDDLVGVRAVEVALVGSSGELLEVLVEETKRDAALAASIGGGPGSDGSGGGDGDFFGGDGPTT